MTFSSEDPYYDLAQTGPYAPAIGSALITMVEPHVGHEQSYNRWYEDDHFYSGAMAFPWLFAGRRWVCPRDLQALRHPAEGAIAQPVSDGKYLALYWIIEGHQDDQMRFAVGTNHRLFDDGRIHMERTHVYTSFQGYRGAVYRDEAGPRDIHALDHPYKGLVMEVVDAPDLAGREQLLSWLLSERMPRVLAGSPFAMCLAFQPLPLPGDKQPYVKDVEGTETRLTLLWFSDDVATTGWDSRFAGAGDEIAGSGLGRLEFSSPFIPTIPGTDTYVDQLR